MVELEIQREGNKPWGLRIVGGADVATVMKVNNLPVRNEKKTRDNDYCAERTNCAAIILLKRRRSICTCKEAADVLFNIHSSDLLLFHGCVIY